MNNTEFAKIMASFIAKQLMREVLLDNGILPPKPDGYPGKWLLKISPVAYDFFEANPWALTEYHVNQICTGEYGEIEATYGRLAGFKDLSAALDEFFNSDDMIGERFEDEPVTKPVHNHTTPVMNVESKSFSLFDTLRAENVEPFKGAGRDGTTNKPIAPPLALGHEYKPLKAYVCNCGHNHVDVGLVSKFNYISCTNCGEKLPDGDRK